MDDMDEIVRRAQATFREVLDEPDAVERAQDKAFRQAQRRLEVEQRAEHIFSLVTPSTPQTVYRAFENNLQPHEIQRIAKWARDRGFNVGAAEGGRDEGVVISVHRPKAPKVVTVTCADKKPAAVLAEVRDTTRVQVPIVLIGNPAQQQRVKDAAYKINGTTARAGFGYKYTFDTETSSIGTCKITWDRVIADPEAGGAKLPDNLGSWLDDYGTTK